MKNEILEAKLLVLEGIVINLNSEFNKLKEEITISNEKINKNKIESIKCNKG